MSQIPLRQRLFYLLAIPCLLWVPVLSFVRFVGYPVTSPEVGLLLLGLAVAGLSIGSVMVISPRWLSALILAMLLLLLLDIQYELRSASTLWIAAGALAIAGIAMLIGPVLPRLLAVIFGVLALTSLFVGAQPQIQGQSSARAGEPVRAEAGPPPVLHIILDEYIGIEAIPASLDSDQTLAKSLTDEFQQHGLSVYSRVFSRSSHTRYSIPGALDFGRTPGSPLVQRESDVYQLGHTGLFERWRRLGYKVRIFQSAYMDYCKSSMETPPAQCVTYSKGNIRPVLGYDSYSVMDRAEFIGRAVWSRSELYETAHKVVDRLAKTPIGERLGLPKAKSFERNLVSAISTMAMFPVVREALSTAAPGDAFFIHLLLPHRPYVFASDCSLRPLHDSEPAERGDSAVRRRLYLAYLDQLRCTTSKVLDLVDAFDQAIGQGESLVVIHGDHGSRIKWPDNDAGVTIQYLATLFAVRSPDRPPVTVRTPMSLDAALQSIYRDADKSSIDGDGPDLPEPASSEPASPKPESWDQVKLRGKDIRMQPFAFGRATDAW